MVAKESGDLAFWKGVHRFQGYDVEAGAGEGCEMGRENENPEGESMDSSINCSSRRDRHVEVFFSKEMGANTVRAAEGNRIETCKTGRSRGTGARGLGGGSGSRLTVSIRRPPCEEWETARNPEQREVY